MDVGMMRLPCEHEAAILTSDVAPAVCNGISPDAGPHRMDCPGDTGLFR
jgi:hypothetical protein